MNRKRSYLFYWILLAAFVFVGCREEICPDICSEALHLETGDGCNCVCSSEVVFNKLMTKWDNLRICIQEFISGEEPYLLLNFSSNYLSCGRTDYLLLYWDPNSLKPHPTIPNAEQGFFRINHYNEFSRDLWGYTKYEGNDTLYIGHGLNPSVSNRSFLCNEPPFHSGKLYFSNGMLNWEKKIYGNAEDWTLESNSTKFYHLTFLQLKKTE